MLIEPFSQYRRFLLPPAAMLIISLTDGVGFVAEQRFTRKSTKVEGLYFLREAELLGYLKLAIIQSRPHEKLSSTSNSTLTPWISTGQLVTGLRSKNDINDPDTQTN
ncbi:hypothetical protein F4811DRAFT_376617 [Daldinia bambusicola]|nr:hypothetical protein F4811DRAFT_376617 [Daldinia bambusicola]